MSVCGVQKNYLIFKDLDRQGANFFPKRMKQKALNQNNPGRPWIAISQSKEEKPCQDDDEGDQNLASPNSLASYQSGLLEARLVEQECREGSSSPMETSAIAGNEAEVKGEEEHEQSCKEKVIQFGSIPEVQINMEQPFSMTFVSPDWSPTPLVSQPNEGPLEIIEIFSIEELEA
ncbi:hypothetical protein RHMOL_Rhmol10G0118400 [Rhododendron molle]|uniref:Uncharacterized protein n=1 Tax=Rhododendron molle TaxID=49168 RepID=A0ACC0M301_RHOML|nr:hypothetical protein RHMOL_Rhmol10G0118400 [Rhododendron molle]